MLSITSKELFFKNSTDRKLFSTLITLARFGRLTDGKIEYI